MDPVTLAAVITAWGTIMGGLASNYRRLNGKGPLSKQLKAMDASHAERFARLEERMVKVEERVGDLGASGRQRRRDARNGPGRSV